MKAMVRAIVSSAAEVQADAVVLAAFGCGAPQHPPQEVAHFFQDALSRVPVQVALFRVFDEPHYMLHHNPDGNIRPFRRRFHPSDPRPPRLGSPVQVPPPPRTPLQPGSAPASRASGSDVPPPGPADPDDFQ